MLGIGTVNLSPLTLNYITVHVVATSLRGGLSRGSPENWGGGVFPETDGVMDPDVHASHSGTLGPFFPLNIYLVISVSVATCEI